MKCIYHQADFDGLCSAAIVRAKYPQCQLIGHDHHLHFDHGIITPGETVYIVDICLPMHQMEHLLIHCDVHWIDHHITSIDAMAPLAAGVEIKGLREIGKAACELTWQYLFPDLTIPRPVWLLGRYDVWDLEIDPHVELFQFGMHTYDTTIDAPIWGILLNAYGLFERNVVKNGKIIARYYANTMATVCNTHAYGLHWEGLYFIALNTHERLSQAFDSVKHLHPYDAMLVYCHLPDGRWKISMYTDIPGIDVSQIALLHGGGGHPRAAGFHASELPWQKTSMARTRMSMPMMNINEFDDMPDSFIPYVSTEPTLLAQSQAVES